MPKRHSSQSIEGIIAGAVSGGLNLEWLKRGDIKPWTRVMEGAGKVERFGRDDGTVDIHQWYLDNKPQRDLAALKQSDPARHAVMAEAKAKSEQWGEVKRAQFRDPGKKTDWDQLYKDHADLVKAAEDYAAFIKASVSDHRIDDIYGDISDHIGGVDLGCYMHYLLLKNEDDGTYLSVMVDARHNLHNSLRKSEVPNFVDTKIFTADGRDEAQIREDVKWTWAEHFVHRNRYAPFYNPEKIDALGEADALRSSFNAAADAPRYAQKVFEFFPAFRRAYGGEDGFYQALSDAFGSNGGQGAGSRFLRLFEQMDKRDRADFKSALQRYAQDRPDAAQSMPELIMAVDKGTGVIFDPSKDQKAISLAMAEADRLLAQRRGDAVAERPAAGKEVFDFFPAFQRAYPGEEGMFQALVDVYGPKGNVRHCSDMGVAHNHWNYARYNHGEETGRQYEIESDVFYRLFEQMGEKDKADFEKAFNRFVAEILPTVIDDIEGKERGNEGYGIAQEAADALTYLKIAFAYGTGAVTAPHWFPQFQDTQHKLLDIAMRTNEWGRLKWTKTFEERAPKF